MMLATLSRAWDRGGRSVWNVNKIVNKYKKFVKCVTFVSLIYIYFAFSVILRAWSSC